MELIQEFKKVNPFSFEEGKRTQTYSPEIINLHIKGVEYLVRELIFRIEPKEDQVTFDIGVTVKK